VKYKAYGFESFDGVFGEVLAWTGFTSITFGVRLRVVTRFCRLGRGPIFLTCDFNH
jgi:hypothetical protein